MGKDGHNSRFLSESSASESRSHSRKRDTKSSHKRHKETKRNKGRERSRSNSPRHRRRHRRSRSRSYSKSRSRDSPRRSRDRNRRRSREDQQTQGQQAQPNNEEKEEEKIEPEKPNFTPSGILAEFTNKVNGVVLKFTEPPEAAVPTDQWKIFPFKGDEALPAMHLHRQSCYLIGKDRNIADIPVDHPTCSSQHAVIQFREIKKAVGETREIVSEIKPYLMDLESKNGTFLNGEKIEPARYYELLSKDVLKFANSSRDYVIMKGE